MTAPYNMQERIEVPLKIVGGNNFGRYKKISNEETFNFIVSDGFLVPYAGYKNVITLSPDAEGRGIYSSTVKNIMVVVIGNQVYSIDTNLVATLRGTIATSSGDVYIAENNNGEVCITDKVNVYVFNYLNNSFLSSEIGGGISFPFQNPGYISFQNGRLIISCLNSNSWVLSGYNDALTWANSSNTVGSIQSKPCTIQAAVPMPGGGNNLLIFGTNVAESWQDLGLALFPYQRNSTFNIDYGCLNASSIAELESFVVWLAYNEQAGPTVMYTQGNGVKSISTDGIDLKLSDLKNPTNCTGFLFRQDGHLIYQFTFPDDNLTYALDFSSKLFFTITDDNLNYHIARQVVFFDNNYYFVSLNGGNVYRFGTQYTNAEYYPGIVKQIPRIRVCPPIRLPNQRNFICNSIGFTIEQGEKNIEYDISDNTVYCSEAIDLSISRDGGVNFGASLRKNMNPTGKRKNRLMYWRLGAANDVTYQLRFNGYERFICTDGIAEIYR